MKETGESDLKNKKTKYCTIFNRLPVSWETCMQDKKQQLEHGTTDRFKVGKGVCQGCILSPCLFHFFAEHIMWNIELNKAQAAIKNGHESLGDSEGQGSLVCSSPRGCKEVDTTEWPNNNCFLIASHNFSFKAFKVFKCLAYHGIWNVVSGLCVCARACVWGLPRWALPFLQVSSSILSLPRDICPSLSFCHNSVII